jgi:regulator of protease activity HflC (stomatin/prohibitin superfamily)/membrane protein implicated in regulation of membrane protease activity
VLPVSTPGILLILLGVVLLILEVKVTSFGLLAVGGVLSLFFGSLMLIDSPLPELQIGLGFILPVTLGVSFLLLFLVRLAVRAQRQQRRDRDSGMLDQTGRALTAIAPGGRGACRPAARSGPRRPTSRYSRGGGAGHRRVGAAADVRPSAGPGARPSRVLPYNPAEGGMPCWSSILLIVFRHHRALPVQLDQDPERVRAGVIFRLGKLLPQPKGPGVILVFAPIDRMVRVSLRTIVMDVPPQDVITRDNVSVKVNAVVYFRVMDPRRAIVEVESYHYATSQLAQTTLRSVLGQVELDDLLSERDRLNQQLQQILDQHTDPWGVKVSSVEVKHVDLPPDMQRAMARQAEAEREKRAKIIHAEGELQASEKLAQAATVIAVEPVTITLRYLQTLTDIASEKNSTIIFPLPIELLSTFMPERKKRISSGRDDHARHRRRRLPRDSAEREAARLPVHDGDRPRVHLPVRRARRAAMAAGGSRARRSPRAVAGRGSALDLARRCRSTRRRRRVEDDLTYHRRLQGDRRPSAPQRTRAPRRPRPARAGAEPPTPAARAGAGPAARRRSRSPPTCRPPGRRASSSCRCSPPRSAEAASSVVGASPRRATRCSWCRRDGRHAADVPRPGRAATTTGAMPRPSSRRIRRKSSSSPGSRRASAASRARSSRSAFPSSATRRAPGSPSRR